MDQELTPQEKFNAESAETMVPRALLAGRSREDIVAELVRLDWAPEQAQALIDRVARDLERLRASPESRLALVNESRREMLLGLGLLVFGLFVTGVGLLSAMTGLMPVWFLASGVIVTGLALALRGHSRWRLYRRENLGEAPRDNSGPGSQGLR
jgi:hypothetical protein